MTIVPAQDTNFASVVSLDSGYSYQGESHINTFITDRGVRFVQVLGQQVSVRIHRGDAGFPGFEVFYKYGPTWRSVGDMYPHSFSEVISARPSGYPLHFFKVYTIYREHN